MRNRFAASTVILLSLALSLKCFSGSVDGILEDLSEKWDDPKNPFMKYTNAVIYWDKISKDGGDRDRCKKHIAAQKEMMKEDHDKKVADINKLIENCEKGKAALNANLDSVKKSGGDFKKFEDQIKGVDERIVQLQGDIADLEKLYQEAQSKMPKPPAKKKK